MSRYSPGSHLEYELDGFNRIAVESSEDCAQSMLLKDAIFAYESGLQISPFSRLIQLIVPTSSSSIRWQWRNWGLGPLYPTKSLSKNFISLIFMTMRDCDDTPTGQRKRSSTHDPTSQFALHSFLGLIHFLYLFFFSSTFFFWLSSVLPSFLPPASSSVLLTLISGGSMISTLSRRGLTEAVDYATDSSYSVPCEILPRGLISIRRRRNPGKAPFAPSEFSLELISLWNDKARIMKPTKRGSYD